MKYYMIIGSIILFIIASVFFFVEIKKDPIKVGVIHSLTGTMANSETSVKNATLLAIEELNFNGGLLNRKVEAVVVDGKSHDKGFVEGLKTLQEQGIEIIFGGWTSASRKAMKPILEKENLLLFYPVPYEGFEASENIIYLGLVPNQQIKPTINWASTHYGKMIYLVGSDYIFPRAANEYIKGLAHHINIEIIGEKYALLGEENFDHIVEDIKSKKPSFIVNTLNGDSNIDFFKSLKDAGIDLNEIPIFSFSLEETLVQKIVDTFGVNVIKDSYATWNYFESLDSSENEDFIHFKKRYKEKYGQDSVITASMVNAYTAVKLFAQTIRKYQKYDIETLRKYIPQDSVNSPGGIVYLDKKNNHSWKHVRIAKVTKNGKFNVVWDSESPQKAKPFPDYFDKESMIVFQNNLYKHYNNRWEAVREPEQ